MSKFHGLGDIALSPEQTASRNANQAFRIMEICPEDLIEHKAEGRYHYDLGPSIKTPVHSRTGDEEVFDVAIAIRHKKPGRNGWDKQPYLVVDRNLAAPAVEISAMPNYGLTRPQSGLDITDREIDLLLNRIEEHVESVIEQRKTDARLVNQRRIKSVKKTAKIFVALIALTGVSGVAYVVGDKIVDDRNEKIRAEEQAHWDKIAAYDSKGIILQSVLVRPGEAGAAAHDRFALSLLDETPEFHELLDNPRKLLITAGEMKSIGTAPLGKGVRAVSNAPDENVAVTVMEDGTVWLTALPADGSPVYDVIIQTQPLPK